MKLYNTQTRKIDTFTPLHDKHVGMYTCGPTVYDRAHIGNMRTYLMTDLLVRTLRFLGYDVTHVMNITDIDDKTINRAAEEGISLSELTQRYEELFFRDLARLKIELPDVTPRATEHFPEMKQLLNQLVEKGAAYEKNGEVYFDISKFKDYGKLSLLDKREIKPGARVAVDEYGKDDVNDFVLWKVDDITKTHDNELTKSSGRPGWHLECSAMSMKYLGPTLDIHAGGTDLLFPHHENEIAQSEAATEKPFARYFVHGEFLTVEGKKMSKSLGNMYTMQEIIEQGVDPLAFRYLILTTHYRSKLNFTWDSLEAASRALEGVRQLAFRDTEKEDLQKQHVLEQGYDALNNDLDFPKLLALLHQTGDYSLWLAFEPVLGLGLTEKATEISTEIQDLLKQRDEARRNGDYAQADQYRVTIATKGYAIEDLPDGTQRLLPKLLDK